MAKATGPVYNVAFRRRRKAVTDYKKRLAMVKSRKPRMVVRKTARNVIVQFVEFAEKGDAVLAGANSSELKKMGWAPRRNLPTAYLTGVLAGKKAEGKGVKEFVLDIGLYTASKNALVFAAAKGALDAGLKANMDPKIIDESRIRGEHISKYAESVKASGKQGKLFAGYAKDGLQPEKIHEKFDAVKEKVLKGGA